MPLSEFPSRTTWTIDAQHSEIAFKVRHLMIAHVKGYFKSFSAKIVSDHDDFSTTVIDLNIEANSITTRDATRDAHLRGADFFNSDKYPQLHFTANKIGRPDTSGIRELWGQLTMKDITRHVQLFVELGGIINDPWGNKRAGFTITGKLNRSEWGLTWNQVLDAGGVMLGDEVLIMCEIELISARPKESEREMEQATEKNTIDI